eukprot:m.196481 g.196481  ORF g.196481 m.196481 type:complete len:1095 (-) comp17014_c0_seq2:50-3334(-)
MPTLRIEGITVEFPFEPYECQVDYMTKMIQALNQGTNAMLESPTGTGKTLCLLCATLAWREHMLAKNRVLQQQEQHRAVLAGDAWNGQSSIRRIPAIIYASRTHSQLSQTVKELKTTAYKAKACILASRAQLCIHPEVSKITSNAAKTRMCKVHVDAKNCHFHPNVDTVATELRALSLTQPHPAMDLEDIVKEGQRGKACPYYLSRSLRDDADIVLLPYNYLLDKDMRRSQKIDLKDSVVIFDEAHNVESSCEDASSFELTSIDIASFMSEIDQILRIDVTDRPTLSDEKLAVAKQAFAELEEALDTIPLKQGTFETRGDYLYTYLGKAGITETTCKQFSELLDEAATTLLAKQTSRSRCYLNKFLDILKVAFSEAAVADKALIKRYFYVHVKEAAAPKSRRGTDWASEDGAQRLDRLTTRTLSFWCFSPAFAMQGLLSEGVASLILTSGTLSPLNSFASELMTDFRITLENPHVIQSNQVWAGVVPVGPGNMELTSTYEKRNLPQYKTELGNCLINFSRIVPAGLLVFFPSYGVMKTCVEFWQECHGGSKVSVWDRLSNNKTVIVEPREKHEFVGAMHTFYEKVRDPTLTGAIFLAVCRGKVSEGLDFANSNGRAVIITGLPYPNVKEPKIKLKRQFMDEFRREKRSRISGQDWYQMQATRAVNQAIGRVIRHRRDYGAIILADARFATERNRNCLPRWLRQEVQTYPKFGEVVKSLTLFFRRAAADPDLASAAQDALKAANMPPSSSGQTWRSASHENASLRRQLGSRKDRGVIEYDEEDVSRLDHQDGGPSRQTLADLIASTAPQKAGSKAKSSLLSHAALEHTVSGFNFGGRTITTAAHAAQQSALATATRSSRAAGSLAKRPPVTKFTFDPPSQPPTVKPKIDRVTSLYAKRTASVETTPAPPSASSQQRKEKIRLVMDMAKEKLPKEAYAKFKMQIADGFRNGLNTRTKMRTFAQGCWELVQRDTELFDLLGQLHKPVETKLWQDCLKEIQAEVQPPTVNPDKREARAAVARELFQQIEEHCGRDVKKQVQQAVIGWQKAKSPLTLLFEELDQLLEAFPQGLAKMAAMLPPSKRMSWKAMANQRHSSS